jgi:hypothetical protein
MLAWRKVARGERATTGRVPCCCHAGRVRPQHTAMGMVGLLLVRRQELAAAARPGRGWPRRSGRVRRRAPLLPASHATAASHGAGRRPRLAHGHGLMLDSWAVACRRQ